LHGGWIDGRIHISFMPDFHEYRFDAGSMTTRCWRLGRSLPKPGSRDRVASGGPNMGGLKHRSAAAAQRRQGVNICT
jgi:hypothetical protein